MMKTIIKSVIWTFLLLAFLTSYANDNKNEKMVDKFSDRIENASPDDWYVLADCADQCLKKNINCKEVAEWIDKSLAIKETPYNLEIKGDYFMQNKLPEKAGKYYLKALQLGNDLDSEFESGELQKKIAQIIKLKTNS